MPQNAPPIEYTVQVWKEDGQFIAHAMPLDVMSSGGTTENARSALDEAVRLFLAVASEKGDLEEILAESAYVWRDGSWCSPDWVGVERHTVAIGP